MNDQNLITPHRWVKDQCFLNFESVTLEDGETVKIGLSLLQELLTDAGWEDVDVEIRHGIIPSRHTQPQHALNSPRPRPQDRKELP